MNRRCRNRAQKRPGFLSTEDTEEHGKGNGAEDPFRVLPCLLWTKTFVRNKHLCALCVLCGFYLYGDEPQRTQRTQRVPGSEHPSFGCPTRRSRFIPVIRG